MATAGTESCVEARPLDNTQHALGQRADNWPLRSVDRKCIGRVSSLERVNPRADVFSETEGSTGAWEAKRAGLGGVLGQGMCTLGFPRNLGGSASLLPKNSGGGRITKARVHGSPLLVPMGANTERRVGTAERGRPSGKARRAACGTEGRGQSAP